MDKERIKRLAEKVERLTDAERAEVRQMATDAGLKVRFAGKCKNCYKDALAMLWDKAVRPVETPNGIPTKSGRYLWLVSGSRFMWYRKGMKIVLTPESDDELIERYMNELPDQRQFALAADFEEEGGEE